MFKKHGMRRSTEYGIWASMWARCSNQNHVAYDRYGGNGVTVCQRWKSFEAFYADVGARPSPGHTIDRFPRRDGNYEPGNVRWATWSEQNSNKDSNRLITFNGKTLTMKVRAERSGVKYTTLKKRLDSGWFVDDALLLPVKRGQRVMPPTIKQDAA